jgi:glyoxylase-like metal-dependent hydrolase (beta-lactamase superfamily II)
MTLDGTNTWVLREPGAGDCVVVDPGPLDEGHLSRVAAQGPVALIVLTHGHHDHAEGAGRLRELTGAPIVARDPALCVDCDPLQPHQSRNVAALEWLTVLTPGHSSDSVCLYLRADRALLTGDTILGRGTTVVAHPDGKLADYLDSLQRLRDMAAHDVDVLLPGHGPVLDAPIDVLDYYLRHRQERLDQVRDAIDAGAVDAMDVVRRVYADVDAALWPAAEKSVRAQLDYLGERRT